MASAKLGFISIQGDKAVYVASLQEVGQLTNFRCYLAWSNIASVHDYIECALAAEVGELRAGAGYLATGA
ncbi:hypothetical protein [Cyanobium sp. HWJ4-Hawea]|uniref:hypothetical protein n=1 Tax=Cyanobium sp. HWJ4-Hawea TaxID=2823713 RepID=UPI0020CC94FE|nr:hypothetical protein [Cyanobium sp. HWJ4-Hawea]